MIIEYYDEFGERIDRLFPKHVKGFEAYLKDKQIPQAEIYENIDAYIEGLPYAKTTKKNYRNALRNYIEEIARNYW